MGSGAKETDSISYVWPGCQHKIGRRSEVILSIFMKSSQRSSNGRFYNFTNLYNNG